MKNLLAVDTVKIPAELIDIKRLVDDIEKADMSGRPSFLSLLRLEIKGEFIIWNPHPELTGHRFFGAQSVLGRYLLDDNIIYQCCVSIVDRRFGIRDYWVTIMSSESWDRLRETDYEAYKRATVGEWITSDLTDEVEYVRLPVS